MIDNIQRYLTKAEPERVDSINLISIHLESFFEKNGT